MCNCNGGAGGEAILSLPVTPGSTLQVNVGGAGASITPSSQGSWNTGVGGSGGFNGGGNGGYGGATGGGGGGGASDVRSGRFGLSDRLVVAGGGGGASGNVGSGGGAGGGTAGGGGTGDFSGGWNATGGDGGTQTAGGAGGANQQEASFPGTLGQGSSAPEGLNGGMFAGGGGGGGYYGGGAGNYQSGGGGGSGYGSLSGVVFHTGVRSGNGQVIITFTPISAATAVLQPNQPLSGNLALISSNGAYSLQLRSDGNLVKTRMSDGTVIWMMPKTTRPGRPAPTITRARIWFYTTTAVWSSSIRAARCSG